MFHLNFLPRLGRFLTCWLVFCHAAIAQTPTAASAPGRIVGRVQNAATGQYLNKARVAIQGTDIAVFTDETGTYRLAHVTGGQVVLDVFYTGLDAQQRTLTVSPGQTVEQNFDLTSVARYGEALTSVKLDSFVVSTSRDKDGESIAINEQRFAPNIKNVMSTDALGDITDGNIGEFLKYMPGLTAEYDAESGGAVASISVRGFPTSMAVISSDGSQMANTGNPTGNSRVFQFTQVSLNNISRLEVTKVPTPSSPADSLAGSVNMVSKSAFERTTAQLRYSISLGANDRNLNLQRTAHPSDEKIFKILPSVSFDYTLPVTKTFGLVVTGQSSNRYIPQTRPIKTYTSTDGGTGASASQPYLSSFQAGSVPRVNNRHSAGLRADLRVTPNGVLTANVEASRFVSDRAATTIRFDTGTNGAPTVTPGVRLTYGSDFTSGATGRGAVVLMNGADIIQTLDTKAANLHYRFDDGNWRIEATAGASRSEGGYQDTRDGRFRQMGITTIVPVRVILSEVDGERPQKVQVLDNNERPVDIYDLRNYRLSTASSQPRDIRDDFTNLKLDVRKGIDALAFPAAVQIGGLRRAQVRDVRRYTITWTYNGPDGNPATVDSPAPYQGTVYKVQDDISGFPGIPNASLYNAWKAFQANPNLFSQTPAQVVAAELFRINNSERIEETVSAGYLQTELGLLRNRLKVLTGVRYEQTATKGQGVSYDPAAVFARNADGTFARNAAGARIRRTEAGAVGSIEELRLTRQERGFRANRTYDGFYPSLHLTYTVKDNLLLRAAYAKTYGRPDFTEIIPNTTVDESDIDGAPTPSQVPGRLNVRNTGLRPWSADNYDLSAEYYTEKGGVFSVGVFQKDITDFFADVVKTATAQDLEEMGLDPRYVGWQLTSTYNLSSPARVQGVEFSLRHSLAPLGRWGKHFQGFVNGTKLKLSGDEQASFINFIPESASWGLSFSRKPFNVVAKWNYRGKQKRLPFGENFEYQKARTMLDLNVDYQIRSSLFLYANVQNVFNVTEQFYRYGPLTPEYAKPYQRLMHGVGFTLGMKGTF